MIALYRGISLLSRTIRWFTWSDYSHAAWVDDDTGRMYEAWDTGVRSCANISENHTPGTIVDLFDDGLTHEQRFAVRFFMLSQKDKKYDYRGLFHFVTRRDERPADQDKWFCSELVFAGFDIAGRLLLNRVPRWRVFPAMLAWSPLVTYSHTTTTSIDMDKRKVSA